MKTALCISGEPRIHISDTIINIYKYIVDYLKCDVFMYAGKDGYENNLIGTIASNKLEYKNLVIKEDSYINEYSEFFGHVKIRGGKSGFLQRYLQQLYSIEQCNNLKIEYEILNKFKYDYVIRCRFDLNFYKYTIDLDKIDLNKITLGRRPAGAIDDCFAIGSSDIMDIYSMRFTEFLSYDFLPGKSIDGAEKHLKYFLNEKKIDINFLNWKPQELKDTKDYKLKKEWRLHE